jgi:hypothetical protein
MEVTPHEAAGGGLWHFMTCVLVPDLVLWRWGSGEDETSMDRWVTVRHRGRNCFGRLWWRAEVLRTPGNENPYLTIHELKEDEFVQIMERPWLAGNRSLSTTTARMLIEHGKRNPKSNRPLFFREVQKRLLRMGAYVEFEALDAKTLEALLSEVFLQTVKLDGKKASR